MAGPSSGKFGMVNGQSAIRNWQVSLTSAPKKYIHSGTQLGPGRKRGIKDWSGSFGCYGSKPILMPGDTFTFAGFTAPTSGVEATNGDVYTGPAIIDSMAITWNWEAGEILSHQLNFSGTGAWSKTLSHYEDAGDPVLHECIGLGITADGETIANVKSAALNITVDNKAYVNSSTAGWTGRKSGVLSDATLAVVVHDTNIDEFVIDQGEDVEFKLYVNDTDYWLLKWMHFKDISNINVNRETGDIIDFTANFELNLITVVADANEYGCIMLPGETEAWWGTTPTP